MTPGTVSRRALLKALVALACLPRGAAGALGPAPRPRSVPPRSPGSAAVVGAAYLRLRPHEAEHEALRRRLGLERGHVVGPATLVRLAARHREDFRRGRVCRLGGWTLSLTEARVCALVHLAGEGSRVLR